MTLQVIYVTRHGFRSNWLVNPSTGNYTASIRSPTGISADPALTAHGVDQAKELGAHLLTVDPPVERVYSSPYYRCLQTVDPFIQEIASARPAETASGTYRIRGETGLSEWYGSAPFEHPTSAGPERLTELFPAFDKDYVPQVIPSRMGESIDQLHDRVATAMDAIIRQCDREGVRAVLLCTHAAVVIALGRVLTGNMPDNVETEDFRAFTCGLTVYQRRSPGGLFPGQKENKKVAMGVRQVHGVETQTTAVHHRDAGDWSSPSFGAPADHIAANGDLTSGQSLPWRHGQGVGGGWNCAVNSECSFLSGGEERGWRFSGDESFSDHSPKAQEDAGVELGVVVEGKPSSIQNHQKTGASRL